MVWPVASASTTCWARTTPDDVLKVTGDPLDDCFDALRYGAYSYIRSAEKPFSMWWEEQELSADPTQAMLQYRRMMQQHKPEGPFAYSEIAQRRSWRM